MERTEVNVTTKISIHSLLNALVAFASDYPMDRLAEYQIERIESAARILRERMKDYEEKKDSKTATTTGTITPVTSNVTMPSGWSFSGLAPIAVERRVNTSDRRKVNDWSHPNRAKRVSGTAPRGRRSTDSVPYNELPTINNKPLAVRGKIGRFTKKQK